MTTGAPESPSSGCPRFASLCDFCPEGWELCTPQPERSEAATTAAINGSQSKSGQTRFAPPTILLFVSANENLRYNAFGALTHSVL
jgi:hypothetical protein